MRMIPACFAHALQRCTSRLCMHFLLTFQEVMPISKTRNQLTVSLVEDGDFIANAHFAATRRQHADAERRLLLSVGHGECRGCQATTNQKPVDHRELPTLAPSLYALVPNRGDCPNQPGPGGGCREKEAIRHAQPHFL